MLGPLEAEQLYAVFARGECCFRTHPGVAGYEILHADPRCFMDDTIGRGATRPGGVHG